MKGVQNFLSQILNPLYPFLKGGES